MVNPITPRSASSEYTTVPALAESTTNPISIDEITSIDQIDAFIKVIDKDVKELSENYLDNMDEVTSLIDRKIQLESKKNELLEEKPNYYKDKEDARIAKLPLPKKVLTKIHAKLLTKNTMKKVGIWTTFLVALGLTSYGVCKVAPIAYNFAVTQNYVTLAGTTAKLASAKNWTLGAGSTILSGTQSAGSSISSFFSGAYTSATSIIPEDFSAVTNPLSNATSWASETASSASSLITSIPDKVASWLFSSESGNTNSVGSQLVPSGFFSRIRNATNLDEGTGSCMIPLELPAPTYELPQPGSPLLQIAPPDYSKALTRVIGQSGTCMAKTPIFQMPTSATGALLKRVFKSIKKPLIDNSKALVPSGWFHRS
jgi:hypothetical protein